MTKEMVGGCCVCSGEKARPGNPLVYCDGHHCTVAVHKACYGIIEIPSGSWFCRKCESQGTDDIICKLCPSKDGALKKTDHGGWAHVVCALYIPEVDFENVSTMEPIVLEWVPLERFQKSCCVCENQGLGSKAKLGACMNCHKPGCTNYFHVTCGQAEGLLYEQKGCVGPGAYCGFCPLHHIQQKKGNKMMRNIPAFKSPSAAAGATDPAVEKSSSVPDGNSEPLSGSGGSCESKDKPNKSGYKSTICKKVDELKDVPAFPPPAPPATAVKTGPAVEKPSFIPDGNLEHLSGSGSSHESENKKGAGCEPKTSVDIIGNSVSPSVVLDDKVPPDNSGEAISSQGVNGNSEIVKSSESKKSAETSSLVSKFPLLVGQLSTPSMDPVEQHPSLPSAPNQESAGSVTPTSLCNDSTLPNISKFDFPSSSEPPQNDEITKVASISSTELATLNGATVDVVPTSTSYTKQDKGSLIAIQAIASTSSGSSGQNHVENTCLLSANNLEKKIATDPFPAPASHTKNQRRSKTPKTETLDSSASSLDSTIEKRSSKRRKKETKTSTDSSTHGSSYLSVLPVSAEGLLHHETSKQETEHDSPEASSSGNPISEQSRLRTESSGPSSVTQENTTSRKDLTSVPQMLENQLNSASSVPDTCLLSANTLEKEIDSEPFPAPTLHSKKQRRRRTPKVLDSSTSSLDSTIEKRSSKRRKRETKTSTDSPSHGSSYLSVQPVFAEGHLHQTNHTTSKQEMEHNPPEASSSGNLISEQSRPRTESPGPSTVVQECTTSRSDLRSEPQMLGNQLNPASSVPDTCLLSANTLEKENASEPFPAPEPHTKKQHRRREPKALIDSSTSSFDSTTEKRSSKRRKKETKISTYSPTPVLGHLSVVPVSAEGLLHPSFHLANHEISKQETEQASSSRYPISEQSLLRTESSGPSSVTQESTISQMDLTSVPQMLGNQLNPASSVAQEMSVLLSAEVDMHNAFTSPAPTTSCSFVGVPFPRRRDLSPMMNSTIAALPIAPGPRHLADLLERQLDQGNQFFMEEGQRYDIASLLSCLQSIRQENSQLENNVVSLTQRRNHLLAVNARLSVPLTVQSNTEPPFVPNSGYRPDGTSTSGSFTGHSMEVSLQNARSRMTPYPPQVEIGINTQQHLSSYMGERVNTMHHPVHGNGGLVSMSPAHGSVGFHRTHSSTPEMAHSTLPREQQLPVLQRHSLQPMSSPAGPSQHSLGARQHHQLD